MKRIALWAVGVGLIPLMAAPGPVSGSELTAVQIVEKNVAARGGLEAWRKIQTMVWVGHIESANAPAPRLPFVLEMKRPDKTRFEIRAKNQMSVRAYDGHHGWKLRATGDGKPDLQSYTAEELSFAHDGPGIDGPLMDYQAKGIAITLDGVEEVEGHKAYRLSVTLSSGVSHHVWIDALSFLDIKSDRVSRNAFGMSGTVSVFYRDYRATEGVQIPFTIESGAGTGKATDRMVIDRVALNPPLDDRTFARPGVPGRRNTVSIDATRPQPLRRPTGAVPSMPPESSLARPRSVLRAGEGR